ncbi:protein-lysine N-methyltransferase EEF2KMT isoform 2 [Danio rerio]|uniref:Protein-lysine N-methyltransferase EEF2KMT isoform 2 n=1 Tax=Danio rerio TaxID=7955 RepID=A0AB13ABY2_DANRE|nr:protein-lysine N-methyltransferase EEF2KMT isoform X1 [Danio rerio]|eukprot:XP_009297726.1 protein-lysine N-methyltransferase EEF2KMT isoform X1 [Danio rerio]
MEHKTRKDIIHRFQVNFLAMSLLNTFPWDHLDEEIRNSNTSDIIEDILHKTCLHPICVKNPPSLKYRRRFLTELIKRQEKLSAEPLDILYEALGEVMCAQEEDLCFKTYLLPTGDAVSLAENVALISQGTTGLVTWEAALYLAEWTLENAHIFKNNLTKYIFSDCHQTVLQRLKDNITNCLANCDGVSVEELDWENVSDEQLQRIQANTIIAADVVYDPDIIACLVRLLSRLLNCKVEENHPDVYVASTVRNPQTYECFKKELERAGLRHVIMKDSVTQVFPYNRASTIEMIKIYV